MPFLSQVNDIWVSNLRSNTPSPIKQDSALLGRLAREARPAEPEEFMSVRIEHVSAPRRIVTQPDKTKKAEERLRGRVVKCIKRRIAERTYG